MRHALCRIVPTAASANQFSKNFENEMDRRRLESVSVSGLSSIDSSKRVYSMPIRV